MKCTLSITASPSALAAILSSLPDGATVAVDPVMPEVAEALPTPAPAPMPDAPQPIPSAADIAPTPVPVAPVEPELDKNGLPWDERINTSNKAKTKAGVYKRKPGIDDDDYDAIVDELKGNAPAPVQHVAPPIPPMPPVMQIPTAPDVAPMPAGDPTPVPAPAEAPSTPPVTDIPSLMQHVIAPRMMAGSIDADYLADLATRVGQMFGATINAITDVAQSPEMLKFTVDTIVKERP